MISENIFKTIKMLKKLWKHTHTFDFVVCFAWQNYIRALISKENTCSCSWWPCITLTWSSFLSLALSKLRLCLAIHRTCYFSNLACDWLSIIWAYSEHKTENGPRCLQSWKHESGLFEGFLHRYLILSYLQVYTHPAWSNLCRRPWGNLWPILWTFWSSFSNTNWTLSAC